ncbi:MAG: chloride channel protein [Clostridia bacterium]|nr:chloride channel protein [Clostridia bacterium]
MKIKNISIYVLLAVVVGIIVGAIDALFGRVLLFITDFRTEHYKMLLPFLPIAGLLITYMYNKCSKESLKGMSLVLETTQEKREGIPKALIPLVMIGTWITHLFGGSAGREGVAVQIGATLSHNISKKLNLPNNGKVMAIVGMSAGFGGLFQTPLAALFFAIEVITVGVLEYEALLPAFVGAYVASTTSHLLGLEKFFVNINDTIPIDEKAVVKIIILGIAFGLAGKAFSYSLSKLKAFMGNKFKNPYVRIGVVSIPLAILLFIVLGGRYCGLGTNIINNCFNDGTVYSYDFILKIAFTVITLSIGFQGGEVTPLFAIGASLGYVLGGVMGLNPVVTASLGYAAVFGSATNTLIAPMLIGLEVFGSQNMTMFVVVCIIAYVLNGNKSIYSAQEIFKGRLV